MKYAFGFICREFFLKDCYQNALISLVGWCNGYMLWMSFCRAHTSNNGTLVPKLCLNPQQNCFCHSVYFFTKSKWLLWKKKKIKRNKAQTGLPHTVTLSRRNSCGCVRCCSTIIGHAHANKKKNQKEIHVWMSRFWRCPFVSSSRDSLELQWDACFFSVAAEASSSSEAAKRRRWLS